MTDVPINAKVECTDGALGKTTNVIINPVTRKVTHIVVKDKHLPRSDTRLVPFSNVSDMTHERITLNCGKDEVAGMPPFIQGQLIQESMKGRAYSGDAYTSQYVLNNTAYDLVQVENLPPGELAICSGMQIAATDGKVGKLDELVLDPETGDITHLLREAAILGESHALYFRLDARIRHLLLDEFQDTSLPQWEVLDPLVEELLASDQGERSAVVVADPKQSIYGWRGARPQLVDHVRARYGLEQRKLEKSYRSGGDILGAVDHGTPWPQSPSRRKDLDTLPDPTSPGRACRHQLRDWQSFPIRDLP